MIDRWPAFCERKAVVLLNKFAPPEFEPSRWFRSKHSLIRQRTLRLLPRFRNGACGLLHHYRIDMRHCFSRSLDTLRFDTTSQRLAVVTGLTI